MVETLDVRRPSPRFLDGFWLKIIAIATMTMDHVGLFMMDSGRFPDGSAGMTAALVLRGFGRLAFPLFAFLLAEGLHHTHDRANYLLRLALPWALILLVQIALAQLPNSVSPLGAQAFTDLLLFGLVIYLGEMKGGKRYLALLPLAYLIASYAADVSEVYAFAHGLTSVWSEFFPNYLRGGYSLYGFLMFLGFYYAYPLADRLTKPQLLEGEDLAARQKGPAYRTLTNQLAIASLILSTLVFWALARVAPEVDPYHMDFQTWCLMAGVLLYGYNGRRGYDAKWFRYASYAYYPVHLALLALIFGLLS